MDSTALLTVVCVAVVVLLIFLTGLCLNCKGNSQPSKIRNKGCTQSRSFNHLKHNTQGQGFTVFRHERPSFTVVPVQPSQHQLTSPSMPDTRRISSCPSSDGGSQSDYINQHVENDAESYEPPPEKTPDYPDYLDVLPDDQNVSQQNLASSLNSGQSYQNIENDDNDDDSDSQHYINVNEDREPATETPVGSLESCSSDGQGSSDYVNAPKQINYHMG
ncbi:linker for activation of T-cells family member 1 isoform X2 [Ictalurus punctatus]|uniref:Linker for activation of T-cells family member 1 isoform X2 n=1 Tax=Ictalurus punctatus TaxID=7998 RepID=A0A2D0PY62_ICTPU|nr:linker for activation of T-cells family member 1 isoform X2 [Ictalurus punctatus]